MPSARSESPLISVITPTWQRHDLLLGRCIPSVKAQDYPVFEHVVVSDGPDERLATLLPGLHQLPEHDPAAHFGHRARVAGLEQTSGKFVAYIDDDDSWRPMHLRVLMNALAESGAGFAYSRIVMHTPRGLIRIGDGPLAQGRILPSLDLLHHRELLPISGWINEPGAPDWNLVRRWVEAGVSYVSVDMETADYYPGSSDFDQAVPVALPGLVRAQ
jgi:glycosyltransferase involved in cell wall biosynthesis